MSTVDQKVSVNDDYLSALDELWKRLGDEDPLYRTFCGFLDRIPEEPDMRFSSIKREVSDILEGFASSGNYTDTELEALRAGIVIRKYIDARTDYENATKPLNSHGPVRSLRHGDPITLRWQEARAALKDLV